MSTIEVRDVTGRVLGERELPSELFDGPVNGPVMHQVVVAGLAARRAGTHSTKTRGEVAGGGAKPWRQKGTGRARHGSIRSPIWTGGGVAHGPKPRDYSMRVNKKMKRAALRSALSDAAAGGKISLVDGLAFDGPRTRDAVAVLAALGLDGRVLLVLPEPQENVEKSFRNLPHVRIAYPGNLSTYNVLYADHVLFTTEALDVLTGAAEPAGAAGEPESPGENRPARVADEHEEPDEQARPDVPDAGQPEEGSDRPASTHAAEAPAEPDAGTGGDPGATGGAVEGSPDEGMGTAEDRSGRTEVEP